MTLPEELDEKILDEIKSEKNKMSVLTSLEKQAIEKGKTKAMRDGLLDILEIKFGDAGKKYHSTINAIDKLATLNQLRTDFKKAASLEEVKAIFKTL